MWRYLKRIYKSSDSKCIYPPLSSFRPLWGRLPNPTSTFFAPCHCWVRLFVGCPKKISRHATSGRNGVRSPWFFFASKKMAAEIASNWKPTIMAAVNQQNGPSLTPRSNPNPHRNKDLKFRPFCQVNQWGFHKPWHINYKTILWDISYWKKIDSWLLSR